MKVSPEVEIACSLAAREAQRRNHDLMTVEHLLYALLHDTATAKVIKKSGGNVEAIKKRIEKVLDDEMDQAPDDHYVAPAPSHGFQRVLNRAAMHVESSGKEELHGHNILIAIFRESDSPAAHLLEEHGVTRYDVVNFVSHGVAREGDDEEPDMALDDDDDDVMGGGGGDAEGEGKALARVAGNLAEKAAGTPGRARSARWSALARLAPGPHELRRCLGCARRAAGDRGA